MADIHIDEHTARVARVADALRADGALLQRVEALLEADRAKRARSQLPVDVVGKVLQYLDKQEHVLVARGLHPMTRQATPPIQFTVREPLRGGCSRRARRTSWSSSIASGWP